MYKLKVTIALFISVLASLSVCGEVFTASDGVNYVYTLYSYGGVASVSSGANGVAGSSVSGYISILPSFVIKKNEYFVKSIGQRAFLYNYGLSGITIPETIEAIHPNAFEGCSNLRQVSMSEGLQTIGSYVFKDCHNLVYASIPSTVIGIGNYAFLNCSSLTEAIIPAGINSLSEGAFSGCSLLSHVELNNIEKIGVSSFRSCSRLNHIILPNTLNTISSDAFRYSGLKGITIPASVTAIDKSAFANCNSLKYVASLREEPFSIDPSVFYAENTSSNFTAATLFVPKGCKEKYSQAKGWKEFLDIIEFGADVVKPMEEAQEVNLGVLPEQIGLQGMVIGSTYYNINPENGDKFDAENGCVVLKSSMADSDIDAIKGLPLSDNTVKTTFKGIVFMLPAGTGKVSINAETIGNISLKVRFGSFPAQAFQLTGRETVQVPYTVAEPTYVYIFAGDSEEVSARGTAIMDEGESSVKVYSYKWEPTELTGISSIDNSQFLNEPCGKVERTDDNESGSWYSLDGCKLIGKPIQKGMYIHKGKKVIIK